METKKTNTSLETVEGKSSVQQSKRRLLEAMIAAPIITSLPSRSAWGANCSISGMLSGNLSRQPDSYMCRDANGKSPGFWKRHPGAWPVDIGTIQKNGITVTVCEITKQNGQLIGGNGDYEFFGGATLSSILTIYGGDGLGFTSQIMDYLRGNVTYPKHLAAAMLTAIHPNGNYPYTPEELADAAIQARDLGKETELGQILENLQNGPLAGDASGMILTVCPP